MGKPPAKSARRDYRAPVVTPASFFIEKLRSCLKFRDKITEILDLVSKSEIN